MYLWLRQQNNIKSQTLKWPLTWEVAGQSCECSCLGAVLVSWCNVSLPLHTQPIVTARFACFWLAQSPLNTQLDGAFHVDKRWDKTRGLCSTQSIFNIPILSAARITMSERLRLESSADLEHAVVVASRFNCDAKVTLHCLCRHKIAAIS